MGDIQAQAHSVSLSLSRKLLNNNNNNNTIKTRKKEEQVLEKNNRKHPSFVADPLAGSAEVKKEPIVF